MEMKGLGLWRLGAVLLVVAVAIGQAHGSSASASRKFYPEVEPVKTIKNQHGDVIDCVDIYQQPALAHPLLKDYKIQLGVPESSERGDQDSSAGEPSRPSKSATAGCPKGSVPILRHHKDYDPTNTAHPAPYGTPQPHSVTAQLNVKKNLGPREYAVIQGRFPGKPVFGASGEWSIWNPHVDADIEYSSARIQVVGYNDFLGIPVEAITAGWMVNKKLFGDNSTRLFVLYQNETNKEGCFNAMENCPGFIQHSREVMVGQTLLSYREKQDGSPKYMKIDIRKVNDRWWVYKDGVEVGYWPGQLFTYLRHGARSTNYGGEVYNSSPGGRHTRTEMGNGEFPEKQKSDHRKVACFKNWEYFNAEGKRKGLFMVRKVPVLNKNCYSYEMRLGKGFCFGGPGYNQNCQH